MKYNFDEIVERRGTNSMNTDGFRQYIFHDDNIVLPYPDEDLVRMWIADMEFACPEVVTDAMRKRVDSRIFGYTKIFDKEYYEVFEAWCSRRYGWTFPKSELVTSNGVIPALYELVGHICETDEKVLILTPSYAYFKHAADFNHRELVCSDLIRDENGDYKMDFEDIRAKASDEKVRLCIFCNPHNPTGRIWTEAELMEFGNIMLENGVYIISDEIHCDLQRKGTKHIPLAKLFPENKELITAMAPSKTFNMAGLMLSNIIIPDEKIMAIWKDRHYDFENPISIAASQAAYREGEDWLNALVDYLDGNFQFTKEFLDKNLPKAKFKIPDATYLAWVDVGAYLPEDVDFIPFYFADGAGVLLEGGNMFVANSDGYIRLNLACPRSMLETGLVRIAELLNK